MPSEDLDEVFLELYQSSEPYLAPIETLVTLFTIKYCGSDIIIKFVKSTKPSKERAYALDISSFRYVILEEDSLPYYANSCELPHIVICESSCIAGLCATLRQIIKRSLTKDAILHCQTLLGFKDSCLLACSEVSVWTKFCEVDIISTLKFFNFENLKDVELPVSIARFEYHMSQPVRLHNLYKYSMFKKFSKNGVISQERKIPEHTYAEGSTISLADIIIFVCILVLFDSIWNDEMLELLPLTSKWYNRMLRNEKIVECLNFLLLEGRQKDIVRNYILPVVENQSLYKSDPKRYKPRSRIFTRQEDVDNSLKLIRNLEIKTNLTGGIFGGENDFDWSTIPFDATPEGGSLPITRLKRKFEQLENLCKPVLNIAKDGDVIVDFCSGSGHLGILIAYLLPRCSVILLENKEESLNKAKERVKRLKMRNLRFYQCNLNYFKVRFIF